MTTWTARLARHVCQCYPFFSGCGTLANRPLLRRLTPAGAVVTTTLRDGSRIRVRPGDYRGRASLLLGRLDPEAAWVFRPPAAPGGGGVRRRREFRGDDAVPRPPGRAGRGSPRLRAAAGPGRAGPRVVSAQRVWQRP